MDVLEKMESDETKILIIGVTCEVCEHCGAIAFKTEKGRTVHSSC